MHPDLSAYYDKHFRYNGAYKILHKLIKKSALRNQRRKPPTPDPLGEVISYQKALDTLMGYRENDFGLTTEELAMAMHEVIITAIMGNMDDPVHLQMLKKSPYVISALKENALLPWGKCPRQELEMAVMAGNLEMVQFLLQYPEMKKAIVDREIIAWATHHDKPHNIEILKLLLDVPGITENLVKGKNEELFWALEYGNFEAAKILLAIPEIRATQAQWLLNFFRETPLIQLREIYQKNDAKRNTGLEKKLDDFLASKEYKETIAMVSPVIPEIKSPVLNHPAPSLQRKSSNDEIPSPSVDDALLSLSKEINKEFNLNTNLTISSSNDFPDEYEAFFPDKKVAKQFVAEMEERELECEKPEELEDGKSFKVTFPKESLEALKKEFLKKSNPKL